MSDTESGTTLRALIDEVRELRTQVEACRGALTTAPRVTLRALQGPPFLGQTVNLIATVTDASGERPIADAPLTFVATWGWLRTDYSPEIVQGSTVAARTDVDGRVWVTLMPPSARNLSPVQQDSLEVALRALDPDASTPADAKTGIEEFVGLYRREGSIELRTAVDTYVRDSGRGLLESSGLDQYMDAWAYVDATVLVFVGTEGEDALGHSLTSAVLGLASLPLRVKDWLGSWVHTYRRLAQTGSRLSGELKRVVKRGGDANTILGRIHREVSDFIVDQRGMIGEQVAREAAQVTLREFLAADDQGLPSETRTLLFPALEIASQTIAAGGHSALAAIGHASTSLSREIDTKVGSISVPDLGGIKTQIDDLRKSVGGKLDSSQFEGFRTEVNRRFDGKVDGAAFADHQRQTNGKLDSKVDAAALADYQRQTNARLDAKVDGATFAEYQRQTNTRIEAKAERTGLTDLRNEMNSALAGKADRISLKALEDNTKRDLMALQDTSSQLKQTVSGLNTSVSRIDKDIVELKKPRRGPGG